MKFKELEEFINQECSYGHSKGIEEEKGTIEIWFTKYLDDGQGRYLYADVWAEFMEGEWKIKVNGLDLEDIRKEYEKLEKECSFEPFECESCEKEECKVYSDLAYLDLINGYLEFLKEAIPYPE